MIAPGLRIGRYEIGKRLGKGGFGVVHLARDVDLDREVAIKVLKPEYLTRPQIVQRFLQEARAAAKIGHPGIVTVFECGQIQGTGTRADGNAYIAMELLLGESLSERLLEGGRMQVAQAIAVARQLADALAAAHAAGIVHRDLKPDNVYLVPDPAVHGGHRVKVLDFGVAKLMEPSEDGINTHSQMMLGTPKYMSPEQARSASKVDHRADIYTLGCMLFEMVCGRPPFSGDSGEQLLAHQKTTPPTARSIVPAVPHALDALIARMLQKSPGDRPPSMRDVGDALADNIEEPETIVQKIPIGPTPTEITTVDESRRGRRRMFVIAAGLGMLVSSLAVFLAMHGRRSSPPTLPKVVAIEADAAPPIVIAPPPVTPDAATVTAVDDASRLRLECSGDADQKRWADLIACAERLRDLDKDAGEKQYKRGHDEMKAEAANRALEKGLLEGDWKTARAALDQIGADSVYRQEAEAAVQRAQETATRRLTEALATAKAAAPRCRSYDLLIRQAQVSLPRPIIEAARHEVPCTPSEPVAKREVKDRCADVDDILHQAMNELSSNNPDRALPHFEQVYVCKGDANTLKLVFASACKSKNVAKAKKYWRNMSASLQGAVANFCISNGIDYTNLNAP